jgi:hypothetical protein
MKIQLEISKDKAGNTVYKGRGWFYKEPVELDKNGIKVKVRKPLILASVSVPNSVGNRGIYLFTDENTSHSFEVQLKYKLSDSEWVFKNEKLTRECIIKEEYFIGNPNNYSCNKTVDLKEGKFYYATVNRYGYLVLNDKDVESKPKKDDRVQL